MFNNVVNLQKFSNYVYNGCCISIGKIFEVKILFENKAVMQSNYIFLVANFLFYKLKKEFC